MKGLEGSHEQLSTALRLFAGARPWRMATPFFDASLFGLWRFPSWLKKGVPHSSRGFRGCGLTRSRYGKAA
jgi:hypothetical protein